MIMDVDDAISLALVVTVGSSKLIEFFIPFADLQHATTHTHSKNGKEKNRIIGNSRMCFPRDNIA